MHIAFACPNAPTDAKNEVLATLEGILPVEREGSGADLTTSAVPAKKPKTVSQQSIDDFISGSQKVGKHADETAYRS
jgi:hypothetical protein